MTDKDQTAALLLRRFDGARRCIDLAVAALSTPQTVPHIDAALDYQERAKEFLAGRFDGVEE